MTLGGSMIDLRALLREYSTDPQLVILSRADSRFSDRFGGQARVGRYFGEILTEVDIEYLTHGLKRRHETT